MKVLEHRRATAAAAARAAGPVVLLAGRLGAMDAPGGGEVQMLSLARALGNRGVRARLWRPWEDRLAEADCLHLFGSGPEFLPVVEAARRRGLPVVVSSIAWFGWRHLLREPRPALGRLAACARFAARAICPELPSWRRRLYHAADLLLPNSHAEAAQLVRYFEVPAARVRIVPNGADAGFAHADAGPFVRRYGLTDFVLYCGRIEPRKNQLGFLRAMAAADLPIVVLGDVVPRHRRYAAACRKAAGSNVRFLRGIGHGDPLLASAYAACRCLALASWFETPGLVALEAAMTGTPLVLPAEGCADEYFGHYARYVDPADGGAIRREVMAAWREGRNPRLVEHVVENFTWDTAARLTWDAYQTVLR